MKKDYPKFSKLVGADKSIHDLITFYDDKDIETVKSFRSKLLVSAGIKRTDNKLIPTLLRLYYIIELPFDKWDKDAIIGILGLLKSSGLSDYTINDIKKILKRFLKFYFKGKVDVEDLIEDIRCVSDINAFNDKKINSNTFITVEEFEKILRFANSFKLRALFSLMLETAIRPQELRVLTWSSVIFLKDYAKVTLSSSKTGKTRVVPVKTSFIHLKRWHDEYVFGAAKEEDLVFPGRYDSQKEMSSGTLNQLLKRASKRAGIQRNIFPYLFRHSKLNELYQNNPTPIITKFAGHSLKTSQVYSRTNDNQVEKHFLEKVFKVSEITPEQKNKYETEIAVINQKIDMLMKQNKALSELFLKEKSMTSNKPLIIAEDDYDFDLLDELYHSK